MKVVLCGANGAMGKLIDGILGAECVGRVSIDGENGVPKTFAELGKVDADVVIDFSHHTAIADVLEYTKSIGAAVVVGTTGHTPEEKALIDAASKEIPVFFTGNVSMGIAVLCRLAKEAASYFPDADIEIVEIHHTRKVDAPSGLPICSSMPSKKSGPTHTKTAAAPVKASAPRTRSACTPCVWVMWSVSTRFISIPATRA